MECKIEYLAYYPSYITEVAQLKYEQWLHTSLDRPYIVWVKEIEESARTNTFPITLIALHHTTLLGFVTLVQFNEKSDVENGIWMITLYVKSSYRKRGIGALIIHRSIEEVGKLGYHTLYLWTESEALTEYYTKLGWESIDQDTDVGEDVMTYEIKT